MAVMRLSIIRPHDHDRAEAQRILEELNGFVSEQPGNVLSLSFVGPGRAEMGRLSVWDSAHHADEVAQSGRNMALRARLIELLGGEEHEEHEYEVVAASANLPAPRS